MASLVDDINQANKNYDQALALSNDLTERRLLASKRHDLRYATRDDAKVAYYVHGSGDETILLVTPSGYGLVTWQPIVELLPTQMTANRRRGIAGSIPWARC